MANHKGLRFQPGMRCHYCGIELVLHAADPRCRFTRDHVTARAKGGGRAGNLVPACWCCNYAKGPMSLEDFRRWVADVSGRPGTTVLFHYERQKIRRLLS